MACPTLSDEAQARSSNTHSQGALHRLVSAVSGHHLVALVEVGGRVDGVADVAILLKHTPAVLGPLVHQNAP